MKSKEGTAMRAYLVERPGEAFRQIDLPCPAPSAGQILVRVHASGVNPLDTKIRAGKAAHAQQPLPAVLGLDMAGVVQEVGPGVIAFRPATRCTAWWAVLEGCRVRWPSSWWRTLI